MNPSDSDELVEQVNYRGISVAVWKSAASGFFYTYIAGKLVRLTDRSDYRRQLENSVDESLGTWFSWPELKAKLVEFPNPDEMDLKLVIDGRIIKVYLISDRDNINEKHLRTRVEQDIESFLKTGQFEKRALQ